MASPEPRRKGWRGASGVVLTAALAAAAMLPVALILGALLTPTLWRLEPVLGMELGGHSGPAGWVLAAIWAVLTAAVTAWVVRRRSRS